MLGQGLLKFYLVRCNCDELSWRKGKRFDDLLSLTSGTNVSDLQLDNVNSRLVFVKAVEEDMAFTGRLVSQLDLGKSNRIPRPEESVIRRVRMNVNCVT